MQCPECGGKVKKEKKEGFIEVGEWSDDYQMYEGECYCDGYRCRSRDCGLTFWVESHH